LPGVRAELGKRAITCDPGNEESMADALISDCRPDGRENSPFAGAMDHYGEPTDRGR
jgi:hypothetical protein